MKKLALTLALLSGLPAFAQSTPAAATAPASTITASAVSAHYATLVYANYEDALTGAKALNAAIQAFTAQPSAEGLQKARKA